MIIGMIDKLIFCVFYGVYAVQGFAVYVSRRGSYAVWAVLGWLPRFGHRISSFFISLFQALTHGTTDRRGLRERNVDYLGYVGFVSLATSLAIYVLTAGPIGRYITWLWMTRNKPWT